MTKTDRPSNYVRNATANWIAFLFVAGVSFFLSPFVVHHLGNTAYGVWSLLAALVGYLGLLDFGVRGAVTRYVAHHHAVSDSENSSSIVSAGLAMYGMLGAAAILIAGVVAYLSPIFFNIPGEYVSDTKMVLVIGGATVAVTMLGAVFGGVVAGLQRFDIGSGVEIVITSVRTAAIVTALLNGYGLVSLAVINLAASLLNGMIMWMMAKRLYPELRLRFDVPLRPHMRTILSFSVFLSAIHIFGLIIYYSDVLVISVFLPVSMVTFYVIAANLCDYARQVALSVSMLMTPRVSALSSAGSARVGEEIIGVARVATLVTAPIAFIFWARGESFINLWMGNEYGPVSGEVLRILSVIVLLIGGRAVATSSIVGVNKHRAILPAYAVEAISNLVLSIMLIKPLGLVGVALGIMIPNVIVNLGYVPYCLAKTTGTSAFLFYRNCWLFPSLASIPFALANVLLERYWQASNLAIFFLQILVTLPLVAAGAWVLCLTPAERRGFETRIHKFVSQAR